MPKKPPRQKKVPKGAPLPMVSVDGIELPPQLLQQTDAGSGVDPARNYTVTYDMIDMPRGPKSLGHFQFTRRQTAEGLDIQLDMHDRQCRGFTQRLRATIHCHADQLNTPRSWELTEEMVDGGGTVPHTKIRKTATVTGGIARIKDLSGTRETRLERAYTNNWVLFDAVGRLPRKKFDPIQFEMLDHFDQLKPDQSLHYRCSREVKLDKRTVLLHMFDHFGFGILPWTYFVNEKGLTVLAVGGMEAYALKKGGVQ